MKTFNEDDVIFTYRLLGHASETEIRLIDPTKERFPQSVFVHNEDEFVGVCRQHNGKYNVYVGINERLMGGTTAEKVMTVNAFVTDVDAVRPVGEPSTEKELEHAYGVTFPLFSDLCNKGYIPYIACSGNGYQVWLALPQTKATDQIEANIIYLQKQTKRKYENEDAVIDNMGDLARVMRVIGTQNITGGWLSRWLDPDEDGHPVRCEKAIEVIKSLNAPIEQPFIDPHTKSVGARRARIYIRNHPNGRHLYRGIWNKNRYDSRSEAEFALVCIMVFADFGRSDVDAIMRECAIGKWKESTQAYRDLTYENAVKFNNA